MINDELFDFSNFRSVLCLNGELPSYNILSNINLPIIAADGAVNKLINIGLIPEIVIGDLDSISSDLLKKIPHLKNADQNYSDFQKALKYIISNNLNPSIICGMSGRFLDHILNNINIFMNLENDIFMDDDVIGFCLRRKRSLKLTIGTKISIFGLPNCRISTRGLKWELNNELLTFPGKNSALNRVKIQEITIDISEGIALIIIYKDIINDAGLKEVK